MSLTDYAALAKPKQLALLTVALMGSYLAGGGPLDSTAALLAASGAAAMAGSTMINMYYDLDIDAVMARTRGRPLPSGRIDPRAALAAGTGLAALGAAGAAAINSLVALAVAIGILSDVVAYTQLTKRYTRLSIAAGGVAGAAPALGGWAAATGSYLPGGVLLALALLAWQPVHVWLLAYINRADYEAAGVASLPTRDPARLARLLAASTLALLAAAWALPALAGTGHLAALTATALAASSAPKLRALAAGHDPAARQLFKNASMMIAAIFTLTPLESAGVALVEALHPQA